MKILTICLAIGMAVLMGCTSTPKAPDVAAQIRTALDQAGLKDVSQSQDRDKGVITLKGNVAVEADKTRAESIARTYAGAQVVSNQIAVLPPGSEARPRRSTQRWITESKATSRQR
jgi:osmotically-inducible protein OsmY